jgi:hypothetical protein
MLPAALAAPLHAACSTGGTLCMLREERDEKGRCC